MITFVGKVLSRGKKWTDHKVSSPKKEQKHYSFFFVLVFHVSADGGPWGSPVCASERPVAFPNSFI